MTEIVVTPPNPIVIDVTPAQGSSQSINTIVVDSSRGGSKGDKGDKGDLGNTGPVGPQGPPGPTLAYTHTQNLPSTTWNITHNLGIYPQVTVQEFGGDTVEGEISYVDANNMTVTFSGLMSGYAHLS